MKSANRKQSDFMENEILDVLLEFGLTPIDWVDASIFAKLTGIEEQELTHRRKKWPENFVWTKQDGNIYYSLRGYNQWLTEQTQKRFHPESESEMTHSKSISHHRNNGTSSRCRIRQQRKGSVRPLKLEVT